MCVCVCLCEPYACMFVCETWQLSSNQDQQIIVFCSHTHACTHVHTHTHTHAHTHAHTFSTPFSPWMTLHRTKHSHIYFKKLWSILHSHSSNTFHYPSSPNPPLPTFTLLPSLPHAPHKFILKNEAVQSAPCTNGHNRDNSRIKNYIFIKKQLHSTAWS